VERVKIKFGKENIIYLKMDEEEAPNFDGFLFTFYFQINKKRLVKFVIKISETRRVKEDIEKIEAVFKEKIFDFFVKNPVRNYQTNNFSRRVFGEFFQKFSLINNPKEELRCFWQAFLAFFLK